MANPSRLILKRLSARPKASCVVRLEIFRQRKAKSDLNEVWHYTENRWGEAQADRYLREINARIMLLCEQPVLGGFADHIRVGYRVRRANRHLIFYKVSATRIDDFRILHEQMDLIPTCVVVNLSSFPPLRETTFSSPRFSREGREGAKSAKSYPAFARFA